MPSYSEFVRQQDQGGNRALTSNDPQRGPGAMPGMGMNYGTRPNLTAGDPQFMRGAMPGMAYQPQGYDRTYGISPARYGRMLGAMGRFNGHVPSGQAAGAIFQHFGVNPNQYDALQAVFRSLLPHLFGNRGY